jgi:hypothetical protein
LSEAVVRIFLVDVVDVVRPVSPVRDVAFNPPRRVPAPEPDAYPSGADSGGAACAERVPVHVAMPNACPESDALAAMKPAALADPVLEAAIAARPAILPFAAQVPTAVPDGPSELSSDSDPKHSDVPLATPLSDPVATRCDVLDAAAFELPDNAAFAASCAVDEATAAIVPEMTALPTSCPADDATPATFPASDALAVSDAELIEEPDAVPDNDALAFRDEVEDATPVDDPDSAAVAVSAALVVAEPDELPAIEPAAPISKAEFSNAVISNAADIFIRRPFPRLQIPCRRSCLPPLFRWKS